MMASTPPRQGAPRHIGPVEFYQILQAMRAAHTPESAKAVEDALAQADGIRASFKEEAARLREAASEVSRDIRRHTRRREMERFGEPDDPLRDLHEGAEGDVGFLTVAWRVLDGVGRALGELRDAARLAEPPPVVMSEERARMAHDILALLTSKGATSAVAAEMQINGAAVDGFVSGMLRVDRLPGEVLALARAVEDALGGYHDRLHRRHAVEGRRIHGDPILTDIASEIEANTDRHGEVAEDGRDPSEVTAYSRGRAVTLARAVSHGLVGQFLREPGKFIGAVVDLLADAYKLAATLRGAYDAPIAAVMAVLREPRPEAVGADFLGAIESLRALDPAAVTWREPPRAKTRAEREALAHREETIAGVVAMLRDASGPEAIIDYVLRRRAERRRVELEETVFYEARIGTGNRLLGVAPGALEVYPADRPRDRLDDIEGEGFPEAARFVESTVLAAELDDLFAATHPVATGERGNGLLVGPPGCGKTAFLRAIGARVDAVGVFVSASDFQTCWLGEAVKNPKRLFDKTAKLAAGGKGGRRRPAFILIDEIDGLLREPEDEVRGAHGVNLVNEFLQLLDGVHDYPGVRLWGATNHPERISNRMMRRFQFVRVVGELDAPARERLLRRMLSCLPVEADDAAWAAASEALSGAVGDVIRKVAEGLWRAHLVGFATRDRVAARHVAAALRGGDEGGAAAPPTGREDRRRVAALLRPHFTIGGDEVVAAARAATREPAVRIEIDEAVASYRRNRAFLDAIRVEAR